MLCGAGASWGLERRENFLMERQPVLLKAKWIQGSPIKLHTINWGSASDCSAAQVEELRNWTVKNFSRFGFFAEGVVEKTKRTG